MMKIILASRQQLALIQDIAACTWPGTYGTILSKKQIEYMLDRFYNRAALEAQMDAGHQFILWMHDKTALGFAGYETGFEAKMTKLHKLYVLPGNQGKRIGYSLIKAVEMAAISAGDQQIILNVNRHNKAYDFYIKTGYTVLREEDVDIGKGYFMNDYILIKTLF